MTRGDIAKAYLQLAQSRAARAGVIAFGAGLALVLIWSLELQDRTGGLLQALADKPRYANLSRERDAAEANNTDLVRKLRSADPQSDRTRRRSGYAELLKTQAVQLQEQAGKIQQDTERAKTLTFTFPGLPPITVRDASAALVWLVCAASLLYYLSWCRRSVLTLYSRALRIFVSELEVDPKVLHDVAGSLPFWIAPLPRRDGAYVSAKLLRSAAGWDRTSAQNHVGLGLVQLGAGLVTAHVVYIGILYSQLDVQASAAAVIFRNTLVLPTTILLGTVFIGIACWWLTPGRVPDSYSFERSPQYAFSRRRRAVLATGLAVVAGATALVAVSPAAIRRVILRPRFRAWVNRGRLAPGFYEAGRNRRVHYVRGDGRPKALKSVPDRDLRHVQIDRNQLNRIHLSAIAPWLAAASVRFGTTEETLTREGIDQELTAAKEGERPTLVWFDYLVQQAWAERNRAEIERALALLDPLAATPGGRANATMIDRRRDTWKRRAARLVASRPNVTTGV